MDNRAALMLLAGVCLLSPLTAKADNRILVAPRTESPSHVKGFDAETLALQNSFFAYPGFTGGVYVAAGDINGDGRTDIVTGAGVGAPGGHVKVFSGLNGAETVSFLAYPGFLGGVSVASGDVNNDGFADIITGAGAGGGPHVKVFNGSNGSEAQSFFAYTPSFTGGVFVAAGDINNDGFTDIITGTGASPVGAPHVKVFDGRTGGEIASFFAYAQGFTGGVRVASGDVDGDGFDDIVTGTDTLASHVKVFSGATGAEIRSFLAYGGFQGGISVAAGDINGDGLAEIITGAGPGGPPHVKVFDGQTNTEILSFFAYDSGFTGGVNVASFSQSAFQSAPEPGTLALVSVLTLLGPGLLRRKS